MNTVYYQIILKSLFCIFQSFSQTVLTDLTKPSLYSVFRSTMDRLCVRYSFGFTMGDKTKLQEVRLAERDDQAPVSVLVIQLTGHLLCR